MKAVKLQHRKTCEDLNVPDYNNGVYNTKNCFLLAYTIKNKIYDSMGQLGTKGTFFDALFLSPEGRVFTYEYYNCSKPNFLDRLCCRRKIYNNEKRIQDYWRGLKDINLFDHQVYSYAEVRGGAINDYYENNPNWKNEWKQASAQVGYPIEFKEGA